MEDHRDRFGAERKKIPMVHEAITAIVEKLSIVTCLTKN